MKLFSNHPARNFRINKRRGEIPREELREIVFSKDEIKKQKNREMARRTREQYLQMIQDLKTEHEVLLIFSNSSSVKKNHGVHFFESDCIYPAAFQLIEKYRQRSHSLANKNKSLPSSERNAKNRISAEKHRVAKWLLLYEMALKNQELFQSLFLYDNACYLPALPSVESLPTHLNPAVEEWESLFSDFEPLIETNTSNMVP